MSEAPLADRLRDALNFALAVHGDQQYGDGPYKHHLLAVLSIAIEHGITDTDLLVATLLHDSVEDTAATVESVSERFGPRVAALVDAVTNVEEHPQTGELLPNRKAKASFTYPRIVAVPGAVTLKLCDRLANARASMRDSSRLLEMYRQEYPVFRSALRSPEPDPIEAELWEAVDGILFTAP